LGDVPQEPNIENDSKIVDAEFQQDRKRAEI
jgi:hypothetical protein